MLSDRRVLVAANRPPRGKHHLLTQKLTNIDLDFNVVKKKLPSLNKFTKVRKSILDNTCGCFCHFQIN